MEKLFSITQKQLSSINNKISYGLNKTFFIINCSLIFIFSFIFSIFGQDIVNTFIIELSTYVISNILWILISFIYFKISINNWSSFKNTSILVMPYIIIYNIIIALSTFINLINQDFSRIVVAIVASVWYIFNIKFIKQYICEKDMVNKISKSKKQFKNVMLVSLLIIIFYVFYPQISTIELQPQQPIKKVMIRENTYADCLTIYNTLLDKNKNKENLSDEEEFELFKLFDNMHGYNSLNEKEFELHEYLQKMSNSYQAWFTAKENNNLQEVKEQEEIYKDVSSKIKEILENTNI